MYSAEITQGSRSTDLTGRSRIRDAALVLFGERGIEGGSLREIAQAAGVTAGLIRHHFGSKDGLRAACDEYALERLTTVKKTGVQGNGLASAGFLADVQPELLVLHRYLARSIVDDSPAARVVFERMIRLSEQWISDSADDVSDRRALACVLAAAQVGMLVVRDQLSDALGVDIADPAGQARISHALIDFYSTPLLSPQLAADAHRALDQLRPQHTAAENGAQRS